MTPPPRPHRRRTVLALAAVLVVAGLAVAAAWRWWPVRPPPPVDATASPYANTRPGVKYVGDAACAGCHQDEARTYRQHPMGRSCAPVAADLEHYDAAARNPFQALGRQFLVEPRAAAVVHKVNYAPSRPDDPDLVKEEAVTLTIGSGQQGRTYLIDHDGFVFQSPISWYTRRQGWDLSPGYETNFMHFIRPVTPACLFCHTNAAEHVDHSLNHYRTRLAEAQPIGCERCHGPGELHVRRQMNGDAAEGGDSSIVNPGRLEPALREAVCEQCHLQGEIRIPRRGRSLFDFRPGLPLYAVMSTFVWSQEMPGNPKAVSHVEQMHLSRCFQKSNGKLGCVSCHDPHRLPAAEERVTWYRGRCLTCHTEAACSLSAAARREQSPADSCIDCHMPRGGTADVAHAALTDHRLPRQPVPPAEPVKPASLSGFPLVYFHRDVDPDRADVPRDLAVAMIEKAHQIDLETVRRAISDKALPYLEAATAEDPEDVVAWEGIGYALRHQGRLQEAVAVQRAVLAKAPDRETALVEIAGVLENLGEADAALGYWQRLVAVNPWPVAYHYQLAAAYGRRRDWPRALEELRRGLQRNPGDVPSRTLLVNLYLEQGDKPRARAEFERLVALDPPKKEELLRWFEEQGR